MTITTKKQTVLLLLSSLIPYTALAKDTAESENFTYDFNGKIRVRYDSFDNLYSNNGEQQNEGYLRRMDLGMNGTILQTMDYELDIKLDREGNASLKTAELDYKLPANISIALGRFDPDFGLELSTSSTWVTGIERSAIWDLAPYVGEGKDAQGISFRQHQKHYFVSLGAFDTPYGDMQDARLVYAPIQKKNHLLHFGYSYANINDPITDGEIKSDLGVWSIGFSDNGNSTKLARAKTQGAFARDYSQALELAYMNGPFSLQAEYLQRELHGAGTQANRSAIGSYAQIAYSLTGESRDYSIDKAKFGRIKPQSSAGAWEIFYRKDWLETQSENGLLSQQGNQGNAEVDVLGVNWYSPSSWKVSANYLHGVTNNIDNDAGDTKGDAVSVQVQMRF